MKKLPLSNVLLQKLACIRPLLCQQPQSLQTVLAVVENMPYCHSAEMKDKLLSEWRVYKEECLSEGFYVRDKGVKD